MISGADSTSNKCGNNKKNDDQVSPARVEDHCSNPCLVCVTTFHHIVERRAAASAVQPPFPPLAFLPRIQHGCSAEIRQITGAERTSCPHAGEFGNGCAPQVPEAGIAAKGRRRQAIFDLGALHEMTRRREIVWRHVARTERPHECIHQRQLRHRPGPVHKVGEDSSAIPLTPKFSHVIPNCPARS
jgi:hypothetical protein